MMWLKIVCVYLVNRCGRDVLFMDADVVWHKDPLPLLARIPGDTLWMDDVARSNRYVPFSANTGFYLVRHNLRTAHFLFAMLTNFDLVIVRAGKGCEIPNFKGSYLGRFPLVLADFWTSDHLSERSRP